MVVGGACERVGRFLELQHHVLTGEFTGEVGSLETRMCTFVGMDLVVPTGNLKSFMTIGEGAGRRSNCLTYLK